MRNVLIHYHLFKNAGSSIDAILKNSFANNWFAFDPEKPPFHLTSVDLGRIINENPDTVAFSSHSIVPPLPMGEFTVYPLVVLRDPIARVMSAYIFEWKKQLFLDSPKGTLAEYIVEKFSKPRANAIEDFQAIRLSVADPVKPSSDLKQPDDLILQSAMAFISSLPLFGLVEKFQASLEMISSEYGPVFPELVTENIERNVTQSTGTPMHIRHQKIHDLVGNELYDELILRNQMDIKLYSYASGLFSNMQNSR